MSGQPVPEVTPADVERIARRDFPGQRAEEAISTLNQYGPDRWHNEPIRVRLAALKLAAGNLERLRRAIASARLDYRDVIAPAEYPSYEKRIPGPGAVSKEAEARIIEDDHRQYLEWLRR